MAVPYDLLSLSSIQVDRQYCRLELRAAFRRLGVPVERADRLPPNVFVLTGTDARRPLCDWFCQELSLRHYEFHTAPAWDLTPAERLTVFAAGLDYMFTKQGAGVLDTYVKDSPESFGARHMLSCLGFKRGPRRLVDGEVRIYYQLTKGVYDARSTIHHGRDGNRGNGDSDVLCPQPAQGSGPAG